ncbi:MAG: hypothetical protein COA86_02405 [Kangiella sp.]|nr:MAG: hypothetical protein COA86_02405 [Kangiella sp.]
MTIDQLKAIDAVVRLGSFKAAAEELHRTQPAISLAIKKLEDDMQIQVFSREAYRVSLTDEGRALHFSIKQVLNELENLSDVSKRLKDKIEPIARLVISHIFPIEDLFELCKKSIEEYLPSPLNIRIEALGGVLQCLRNREADIAIAPLFAEQSKEGLKSIVIGEVDLVPVVPSSYQPAQVKQFFLDRELHDFPQVVILDSAKQAMQYNHGVLETDKQWVVNNFNTKKEIILAGLGWGRIPRHMIIKELNSGLMIEIKTESVTTESYMIYATRLRGTQFGPVLNGLWQHLESLQK